MKITARSGCKLNWFLKVIGKRPDGYHDIATLFQYLPYPSDGITLDTDAAPGIRVSCGSCDLPQDLDNLAGKAAAAYAEVSGIAPCWSVEIVKGVPAAAGLGGGSADAGTVLRLLNAHYHALEEGALCRLAAGLGADVPFFLAPGLVFAEGIGEKMTRFAPPEVLPDILIVNPGFPVSAKWAYTHLESSRKSPPRPGEVERLLEALARKDVTALAKAMHNDLEYALYEKFPLLNVIREELYASGAAGVLVSGSGSSLFAVFADSASRKAAALRMKELFTQDPVARIFEIGSDRIYE